MVQYISSSIVRVFTLVVLIGIIIGMGVFTWMIGAYNYDRSMLELSDKATNTAKLAAVSLVEPVWNFNTAEVQGIVSAIMLDTDVQGIRLTQVGEDKPQLEKLRDGSKAGSFSGLIANVANLQRTAAIVREDKEIASIQIVTSSDKVLALVRFTSIMIAAFAVIFVALLSGLVWWLGRRIIQQPIDALRNSADQLASGNLDYAIDTRRSDELGSLAVSFDKMRNAIRRMLAVIEEHNRTLEQKILERTAELQTKTNDVNTMLQNMRQGIFTIVQGGIIHPEYSAYLREIFEVRDIASLNVSPFLFANSSVVGDELAQVDATLNALIGEEAMNFEFNSHLLVTEYTKNFADGRCKTVELDWNPVLNADGLIDKLMVTARDVTELKALQCETEQQKEQLAIIGQILAMPRDKLLEFFKTSYEFLDENQSLIEQTPQLNLDVVATLFRNLHTVKGNARTYGLSYCTNKVHEAESAYSLLRAQHNYEWNQQALLDQLGQARACIAKYEDIYKSRLAGYSNSGADDSDPGVMENIASAIARLNADSSLEDYKHFTRIVRDTVDAMRYESVQAILHGIVAALPSIARQLGKEVPELVIQDYGIRIRKDIVPVLRNVFMHLFRNSLDHGIESTADRTAAGKPAQGRILLEVSRDDNALRFRFSDDGRGLALEKIHAKACSDGRLTAGQPVSDEELAEMIFLSGVTTAEAVTDLSGRGVGMDAVRRFLHKHLGDISLVFTAPTKQGYRPFCLKLTLPPSLTLVDSE
jgi:signal transduction histidine kinase